MMKQVRPLFMITTFLLTSSLHFAVAQPSEVLKPSQPGRITTEFGSFAVPLDYFCGDPSKQIVPPFSNGPRFCIAFWMPLGLPLKEPYIEQLGRPLYKGKPAAPEDFVFVAVYNPESKLVEPLIQFGNITVADERGLKDFKITQVDGLLRLYDIHSSHNGIVLYYGGRFVPEQKDRESIFVRCFDQERDSSHPVCGGTAQLDALSARFDIEIPAAHIDQNIAFDEHVLPFTG